MSVIPGDTYAERAIAGTLSGRTNAGYSPGGGSSDVDLSQLKGVVFHGSNASAARPTGLGSIEWRGTVAPTNATSDDVWIDEST